MVPDSGRPAAGASLAVVAIELIFAVAAYTLARSLPGLLWLAAFRA